MKHNLRVPPTGTASLAAARDVGRVPMLDAARFFAAISVMVYHFGYRGGFDHRFLDAFDPVIGSWTRLGYIGVEVFFVISGFVIAWSAQRESVGSFVWRRWLRVYPTYVIVACSVAAIIALIGDPRITVTMPQVLAHLAIDARVFGFGFVDGSYWTITTEVTFYVWVGIAMAIPTVRRRSVLWMWIWLGLATFNEFVLHSAKVQYLFITDYADLFIVGMAWYRIRRQGHTLAGTALLVCSGVAALLQEGIPGQLHNNPPALSGLAAAVLLCAVVLMFKAMSLRVDAASARRLKTVGALTYPLYLLHQNVGYIAINKLAPLVGLPAALGMTMVLILLASAFLALVVEPPVKRFCIAVKNGWENRRAATALKGAVSR